MLPTRRGQAAVGDDVYDVAGATMLCGTRTARPAAAASTALLGTHGTQPPQPEISTDVLSRSGRQLIVAAPPPRRHREKPTPPLPPLPRSRQQQQ